VEGIFRGVEYQVPTPGGSPLHVFMGVAEGVDLALASGDIDEVTAAQTSFREERRDSLISNTSELVSATSDDGAILLLRA
jgi:hypothetical protein